METIYEQLAELLEVDTVNDTDVLVDFECWDSLTQLSIIALVNENYDVVLSAADIKEAKTIGGLKELINNKK
ncbi:MAG: phosphopantetheine-binding protein [Bacteroidales bacterium]